MLLATCRRSVRATLLPVRSWALSVGHFAAGTATIRWRRFEGTDVAVVLCAASWPVRRGGAASTVQTVGGGSASVLPCSSNAPSGPSPGDSMVRLTRAGREEAGWESAPGRQGTRGALAHSATVAARGYKGPALIPIEPRPASLGHLSGDWSACRRLRRSAGQRSSTLSQSPPSIRARILLMRRDLRIDARTRFPWSARPAGEARSRRLACLSPLRVRARCRPVELLGHPRRSLAFRVVGARHAAPDAEDRGVQASRTEPHDPIA